MQEPILLMMLNKGIEIVGNKLMVEDNTYNIIRGKHEVWIPDLEMKIIWSYNGKIEALKDWDKGRHKDELINGTFGMDNTFFDPESIESMRQEYILFEDLASKQMAPEVYGMFYINDVTHDVFGFPVNDPFGMFGFYMKDANKLPPGKFTKEKFLKEYIDSGKITMSRHALNDIFKDENIVNGYLVDLRRTFWDMLKINDEELLNKRKFTFPNLNNLVLEKKIRDLTQFPLKKRKMNYQTYYLDGKYKDGSRDTLYRYSVMKIDEDLSGKTVVDLGCNLGAVCVEAYLRGASRVLGIDYEKDYITCARELARANNMNINFMRMDLSNTDYIAEYIKKYLFGKPVDILFALSLYKHIKKFFWDLLDKIDWKVCYIETNNVPRGLASPQSIEIVENMVSMDWSYDYLGLTTDRSPRCVWRVMKE